MVFRFQWHIDKLALGVRLGLGYILTSPLNNTKRIYNQKEVFSTKKTLEKETSQEISWRFWNHYISIPEIEKQTKWKYLGNNSVNYWYLHNFRKKMFYGSVDICSFECWRSHCPTICKYGPHPEQLSHMPLRFVPKKIMIDKYIIRFIKQCFGGVFSKINKEDTEKTFRDVSWVLILLLPNNFTFQFY